MLTGVSDSGLEADQKVLAAHGCYAMTATTALTAQNTMGVIDIFNIPPDFVRKQIDACFDDIGVDVVKIGMLACVETIEMVAEALRARDVSEMLVVDPVCVHHRYWADGPRSHYFCVLTLTSFEKRN